MEAAARSVVMTSSATTKCMCMHHTGSVLSCSKSKLFGCPEFVELHSLKSVSRYGRQKTLRMSASVKINGSKLSKSDKAIGNTNNGKELKDVPIGLPEDIFRLGRLVEGRLVYRQTFLIRSYEVGADMCGSIETIMNYLQETALNHACVAGLAGDGFGATHEMTRLNLIWVVTRMQVEVERYPSWGDVVEIDTWVASLGKNSMRRDWLLRDYKTGQILTRATSTWVMMNRETRRLSKFPDAVKEEIFPYYLERSVIAQDEYTKKLDKLADHTAQYLHSGLTPKWSDLDVNRHVNNVKYIGWIMESMPVTILENYELANMTLEYKRECGQSNILQSLTSLEGIINEGGLINTRAPLTPFSSYITDGSSNAICKPLQVLQCTHMLRLEENGLEIVRGRTEWRSRQKKN
eukprot:Gb_21293 [translate_table: standard]